MEFTTAMIIGSTLKKRHSGFFIHRDEDGELCGCATGGALLAVGVTQEQYQQEHDALFAAGVYGHQVIARMSFVRDRWPWLTAEILNTVSQMYSHGKSVEEIADHVKQFEPRDEPEEDEQAFGQITDTGLEMEHSRFGYM